MYLFLHTSLQGPCMCCMRSCLTTSRSDTCFSWIPSSPVETPAPLPLRWRERWITSYIKLPVTISNFMQFPTYRTFRSWSILLSDFGDLGQLRFWLCWPGCSFHFQSRCKVLTKLRNVKEDKIILITIIAAAKGSESRCLRKNTTTTLLQPDLSHLFSRHPLGVQPLPGREGVDSDLFLWRHSLGNKMKQRHVEMLAEISARQTHQVITTEIDEGMDDNGIVLPGIGNFGEACLPKYICGVVMMRQVVSSSLCKLRIDTLAHAVLLMNPADFWPETCSLMFELLQFY